MAARWRDPGARAALEGLRPKKRRDLHFRCADRSHRASDRRGRDRATGTTSKSCGARRVSTWRSGTPGPVRGPEASKSTTDANARAEPRESLVGHLGVEPRANGLRRQDGRLEGDGTAESPQKSKAESPRSSPIVEAAAQSRPNQDAVETALAEALNRASEAAQWDVVAMLARELQARREVRAGVVDLEMARERRGTP